MKVLGAGAVYFAAVFAVGFVLGAVRTLAIEPVLGPLFAVLIELPFMLAACWIASEKTIARFQVSTNLSSRFFMGLIAFTLLMTAEYALSRYGFGRTGNEQLRRLASAPGAVGLAGQILFAMFPMMQIHMRR